MTSHDVLTQLNVDVNNGSPFATDIGEDDWTPAIPKCAADCDSFATAKFLKLTELGWPLSALRLATCWTETDVYHCVLLVDMDGQTYVMDNRYPLPMEYQLLRYVWHKFQVPGTQRWEYAQEFMDNLKRKI